jgi:hypothetical protein
VDFASIISVILGAFKFFDQVKWFVELLQKTPQEKLQDIIGTVDAAFKKADAVNPDGTRSDDTSDIEDIING